MKTFATYLHPQIVETSRPVDTSWFAGHSCPHFSEVRRMLAGELTDYPALPVRKVAGSDGICG